jgi:hypothetical protein
MFDSEKLEVGIGMVFLFLMMSLICTGIREFMEGMLKWRAMDLERAIRTLLDDKDGTLSSEFYSHPLVSSLYRGGYDASGVSGQKTGSNTAAGAGASGAARVAGDMPWFARRNLPSYIPSETFAKALIDLIVSEFGKTAGGTAAQPLTVTLLQDRIDKLPSVFLRRAVQSAIDHSSGDLERMKQNLQQWFDGSMDRAAGWYKRRTQTVLFFLGLVVAVALNVDSLYVMSRLMTDKILRDTVVAAAADIKEPVAPGGAADAEKGKPEGLDTSGLVAAKKARDQLNDIGLPMGWADISKAGDGMYRPIQSCKSGTLTDCDGELTPYRAFQMGIGWLITAIGVMLGAPFWFDVLNKFMVIRATVKPHEKSPEEGSEDRTDPKRPPKQD